MVQTTLVKEPKFGAIVECKGCGRLVPATLYCIMCGAPIKAGKEATR
jgi:uncharacterized OB-fold protein